MSPDYLNLSSDATIGTENSDTPIIPAIPTVEKGIKSSKALKIDRQQALEQLSLLGYQDGDRVYLRAFFPKDSPDKGEARSWDGVFPNLPWGKLETWQRENRGVYFVVNGQGQKRADITQGRAIFYEHDDMDKALQVELWRSLELPEPTLQVDTGGRSVHSYWVFDAPIPGEDWDRVQANLLEYADGDRKLKDRPRVMRLAGAYHVSFERPESERFQQSRLISKSGKRYSYQELRERVPQAGTDDTPAKSEEKENSDPDITDRLIQDALNFIPRRVSGHNTYENYRKVASALKPHYGEERAIQIMEAHSPSAECGWDVAQVIRSSKGHTLGTLFYEAEHTWGWKWPEWAPKRSKANKATTAQAEGDGGDDEPAGEVELCKLAAEYRKLETLIGDRLRLNTLTKNLELDGEPITLEKLQITLALKNNKQFRSLGIIAPEIAEGNKYSPVVEYLESCHVKHGKDTSILEGIADRYFGQKDPIYDTFVKRWLISAVARAYEPGCKVDTSLILQGKQGAGKSTFFKYLASRQWFDDSLGAVGDKDERLKLHRAWVIEWPELETVFRRKDVSAVKAFLSCDTDFVRPPYGKEIIEMKRHSVIVGTTNKDEFLSDSTGNRRFWVLPVKKSIDTELLISERDRIWGAAVALFKSDERWWLSKEEEARAEAIAEEYQHTDPWQNKIQDYLTGRSMITTSEVLTYCLQIDLNKQDKGHQLRVTDILKVMGWEQSTRKYQGKRQRVWLCPLESQPSQPFQEVVTEVVIPETLDKSSVEASNHNHHNLDHQKTKKTAQKSQPDLPLVGGEGQEKNRDLLTSEVVTDVIQPRDRQLASDSAITTQSQPPHKGCDSSVGVVTLSPGDCVQTPDGEGRIDKLGNGSAWVLGKTHGWYRDYPLNQLDLVKQIQSV